MKILSIECSAVPCSVAILEDENIIASTFINVKLTHSQTLMPMVETLLKSSKTEISDIDAFAVSEGPGSFTGIRIGISAIKGLAAPCKKKCVGVSTLLTIANNYTETDCIVCAVMDARCNQVYNALFEIKNGVISRLCDDRALMCEELKNEISNLSSKNKIIIVGDGANVFYPYVKDIEDVILSDIKHRYQNAVGVGFAALKKIKSGKTSSPNELLPVYLRLPQAERELKQKGENK